jgi:anti-anti-sigma factor
MGTYQPFGTTIQAQDGVTSLSLTGELDVATVPALDAALAGVESDGGGPVVVDLRELTFIDGAGVRALLRAHERSVMNGHRLLLVGASTPARRVFQLTGTDGLLEDEQATELLGRFDGDGHPGIRDEATAQMDGSRG